MRSILVTGTDTGVGKTVVACALTHALRRAGCAVAIWKPVETGWDAATAERSSDAARLRAAAGTTEPLESVCPYRLRTPVAPAIAARLEGVAIDPALLRSAHARRAAAVDVTIVEGAGGLLVPITDRMTYLDFAQELDLATLIVAADRLGVINHTALTARVAIDAGLSVVGFVLNDVVRRDGSDAPDDVSPATNRDAIIELTGLTCLGKVAHDPGGRPEAAHVADQLDIAAIRRALGARD